MEKKGGSGIKRGQPITFRLPSDTPDHIIRQLQKLKETERRNFSSKMAEFILEGVSQSLTKEKETVTIPLPKQLSKEQRNWLKHAHSEAMLGSIVYQLLANPVRATSLLASLNSNALDINDALYLQENNDNSKRIVENTEDIKPPVQKKAEEPIESISTTEEDVDDDLDSFDWEMVKKEVASTSEEDKTSDEVEEEEDLLGGFLAQMNK
jgi:hypothetical protein